MLMFTSENLSSDMNVNVNSNGLSYRPLQSSSSEVLSSVTRRPFIETGMSSVLV